MALKQIYGPCVFFFFLPFSRFISYRFALSGNRFWYENRQMFLFFSFWKRNQKCLYHRASVSKKFHSKRMFTFVAFRSRKQWTFVDSRFSISIRVLEIDLLGKRKEDCEICFFFQNRHLSRYFYSSFFAFVVIWCLEKKKKIGIVSYFEKYIFIFLRFESNSVIQRNE